MEPTGQGRLGVLIVAEAPGRQEDEDGIQLIGDAGQLLRRSLDKIGVDLDRDCWKTNALACRPPRNRKPDNKEIDYCRPMVFNAIKEYQPKVILLLGLSAIKSVLGVHWNKTIGKIGQWIGWQIPLQSSNTWICPTYHPSYLLHSQNDREYEAIKLWFDRHSEAAFRLDQRPWKEKPDYYREISVIRDPDNAAARIREFIRRGGAVSFDFETNRLKPDAADAQIVCCGVCWRGRETIAYPWVGDAIQATGELLDSDLPKIGANKGFEERWSRRVFGRPVRNWAWCCVLSAHHLDCRKGICSVKFQSFVRLGLEPYNEDVEGYLTNTDATGRNRILQCDQEALLRYCGMDALVEYKIAQLQRREMNGV